MKLNRFWHSVGKPGQTDRQKHIHMPADTCTPNDTNEGEAGVREGVEEEDVGRTPRNPENGHEPLLECTAELFVLLYTDEVSNTAHFVSVLTTAEAGSLKFYRFINLLDRF